MTVPVYNVVRCPDCHGDGCGKCNHCGHISVLAVTEDGRLIRAATDVARAQRAKGIAKYKSTLEDQNGYTIGGMIDMVAEELADGSVYVQKVREMYLSLLTELHDAVHHESLDHTTRLIEIDNIIKRERNNA